MNPSSFPFPPLLKSPKTLLGLVLFTVPLLAPAQQDKDAARQSSSPNAPAGSVQLHESPADGRQTPDTNDAVQEDSTALPYEQIRRFALVYAAIKNRYVESIDDEELTDAAIEGMLERLDPHSSYLDRQDLDSFLESTEGQFSGLGIEVSSGKTLSVIAPIEGSPADKAGILPGDEIIAVNGKSVGTHSVAEVLKQLRGTPGSTAHLKIKRHGRKDALNFSIKRQIVMVRSVRSSLLEGNIAYVRISQFQAPTVSDLVKELRRFKQPPAALVLDLRNNPGGLLEAAVGVAGAFLAPDQLVVSTKSRSEADVEYHVTPKDYADNPAEDPLAELPPWTRKVPMAVLINVGSASASEIVSGALQDYKRATLLGNRSFGKGSVQMLMPIDDESGLKLTVARYYTPKDRSIQARGIQPDEVITDTAEGDLFAYAREADLPDHLHNESEEQSNNINARQLVDPATHSFEFGSKQDFQLQQAVRLLRGEPIEHGILQDSKKQAAADKNARAQTNHAPKADDPAQQGADEAGRSHAGAAQDAASGQKQ